MPAYNAVAYIEKAIDSAIAQTFASWELIIVDDCSADTTAQCVRSYSDPRIRYLKNDQNSGVARSRNRAIDEARGEYIAFLDSDDVWLPFKLEAQVQLLDSGCDITYGTYLRIAADGRPMATVNVPCKLGYSDMLKSNFIGHLTGIYRKSRFPVLRFEAGGHEDYVFWLRAVKIAGEIQATLPGTPLAHYRVLDNSLSSDKKKAMRWQWRIYRKVLNLSLVRSSYYFSFYIFNAVRKRSNFLSGR
jgi:glycosyltransferase involved in cell wall biosynthesis